MMKKLLLLSSVVLTLTFGANAQKSKLLLNTPTKGGGQNTQTGLGSKTTAFSDTVLVLDTLHYYLNKFYFKTATTDFTAFPYYKSAAATVTNVTHLGSRFDVPAGQTVTITGLEAYAAKNPKAAALKIPVHLYLCSLDGQGMPVLPPIDSVIAGIGGVASQALPKIIGGSFVDSLTVVRTMTASFAVLIRNFSTNAGDTARLLRTAGTTQTNSSSPANTKYSDSENGHDYGFIRYNHTFYSTRDFTLAPDFGIGTAYEFMIAPRVKYKLYASQKMPDIAAIPGDTTGHVADTVCARTLMTFTNTSSPFFEHRQYNLNQFYRKWSLGSPFPPSVASAFTTDSSICWSFEFYDAEQNPPRDSRVFLPYVNTETISAITGMSYYPNCFTANQFRARLKPMGAKGLVPQLVFNQDFIVCFRFCNGDSTGIKSFTGYDNLKVYPNPAVNGKTQISGLEGKNTIVVYNMMGQTILTEVTENNNAEIDLSKQPKGTYFLKVVNTDNKGKAVKLLNP